MKLPYFKKRYYLSGIDWIINAIDYYMLLTSPAGNHSTLIIETENPISADSLKRRLELIYVSIPLLNACLGRDIFNLAPYWKITKKSPVSPMIRHVECNSPEEFLRIKEETLNLKFPSERDHLFFTIIDYKEKNTMLMTFDHKFLDARGAELFLYLLMGKDKKEVMDLITKVKITDSPKLKEWNKKIDAGRDIQRHLIKLSRKKYIALSDYSIKKPPEKSDSNLKSQTTVFSEKESEDILVKSENEAGFMMETPFLLAVTSLAIHQVISPDQDANYSVPIPIDMRTSGCEFQKLLFNHLSFMFLDIAVKKKMKLSELIHEIRNLIFYNIENQLPEKLIKATRLTRISPLPILKHFMKLPLDGKVASFAFANVGELPFPADNILTTSIKNISHLPRIPTPPGLGIFFNRYHDRIQFTLTWDKNVINKKIAFEIIERIINLLI